MQIAGLLLAAGEAKRMGGLVKPLIRINDTPLIGRLLAALKAIHAKPVCLVTGPHHAALDAAGFTRGKGLLVIQNPDPSRGIGRSVRLGFDAVHDQADLTLVMLADQPLINAADLNELIQAFQQQAQPQGKEMLVPMVNGQRGHPVVFSRKAVAAIHACPANVSARGFMDQHPDLIFDYESSNTHFVEDLDQATDLERIAQAYQLKIDLPAH